jgi:hypothetical protein
MLSDSRVFGIKRTRPCTTPPHEGGHFPPLQWILQAKSSPDANEYRDAGVVKFRKGLRWALPSKWKGTSSLFIFLPSCRLRRARHPFLCANRVWVVRTSCSAQASARSTGIPSLATCCCSSPACADLRALNRPHLLPSFASQHQRRRLIPWGKGQGDSVLQGSGKHV